MKKLITACWIVMVSGISGCFGWGDYMKFPPNSSELWNKTGIAETQKIMDIEACARMARDLPTPIVQDYGKQARDVKETCMLEKGYTFTNARPPSTLYHCRADWYCGGPACISIGR
jgi:hypothetical protein